MPTKETVTLGYFRVGNPKQLNHEPARLRDCRYCGNQHSMNEHSDLDDCWGFCDDCFRIGPDNLVEIMAPID